MQSLRLSMKTRDDGIDAADPEDNESISLHERVNKE